MKLLPITPQRGSSLALFVLMASAISCQDVDNINVPINKNSDIMPAYFLRMGISSNRIKNVGGFYIVDGDMAFRKSSSSLKGARPNQLFQIEEPLVSSSNVDLVTIRVDNSFSNSTWRQNIITALQQAIGSWNDIAGTKLDFSYTTSTSADITVKNNTTLTGDNYARTFMPAFCDVGTELGLANATSSLVVDQLRLIIAHELGHTIGLLHTDGIGNVDDPGTLVPTTGNSDSQSIMNSGSFFGTPPPGWSTKFPTGIQAGDRAAVGFLYPDFPGATVVANYGTETLDFRWTPSHFCAPEVIIKVSRNGVDQSPTPFSRFNNGEYFFGPSEPGIYDFRVEDPNNPTRALTASANY